MQIKDVMTQNPEYIPSNCTLVEAAQRMKELDTGFLAIGDDPKGKLQGVVTDRDITIRCVAEGADPNTTSVREAQTDRVLYCFEDDDVDDAARNMQEQQVYRLIVLNNRDRKRLSGIVTLGDIARRQENPSLVGQTAKGITTRAA